MGRGKEIWKKSNGIKMRNYAGLYKGRGRDREQAGQGEEKNNWAKERKMRDDREKGWVLEEIKEKQRSEQRKGRSLCVSPLMLNDVPPVEILPTHPSITPWPCPVSCLTIHVCPCVRLPACFIATQNNLGCRNLYRWSRNKRDACQLWRNERWFSRSGVVQQDVTFSFLSAWMCLVCACINCVVFQSRQDASGSRNSGVSSHTEMGVPMATIAKGGHWITLALSLFFSFPSFALCLKGDKGLYSH